jgi:Na+/melibiose symporter-like transporter
VLVAIGLGGLTYGLLAWPDAGLRSVSVWLPLVGGVGALVAFFVWESRAHMPMLPLGIFSSALFNATNLVTFVVYAALGGVFFWLVLTLQVVTGFTPLAAGTALLPITVVMLALSARAGALGQRVGPRLPMTAGPLLAAVGVAGMVRIGEDSSYLVDVLPAVTVLGLGLALTVAPLTATALAAAPANHAGLASGVNNAVARVAGLLAVAILPVLVGLSGEAYSDPDVLGSAFHTAMWVCAALLALGGLLAAVLVRAPAEEPRPSTAGRIDTEAAPYHHCSVDAPPLAPTGPSSGPGA